MSSSHRSLKLKELLSERILFLDGAMGTSLQQRDLSADDFGGEALEGCNENLLRTRPDLVAEVHRDFLLAGADIIETNTFGSTALVLAEYGLGQHAREISRLGAEVARKVADEVSTVTRPRFVAGSMGPTTRSISVTGGISWDDLAADFHQQAAGLIEGGADLLLVETCQDTLNIKAALEGIDRAKAELGSDVPIAVQGTVETMGTLLAGQDVEALYVSLSHRELLWIGLNCATGPDFMTDHIRTLAEISRFPLACVPNAGLPDEEGNYNENPERLAAKLSEFAEHGWVNVAGGCCGTVPEHIGQIVAALSDKAPRKVRVAPRSVVSGIEAYEISDEKRPVIVGERTNVLGSRRFKRLIAEGRFEEAAEIGRAQVRKGAAIVDVCLQDPDGDELADLPEFLNLLVKKIKVPVMIDSTDPAVIGEALKHLQGKAVINSINLEEGLEKFDDVIPLVKRFGAAVVVGCIDDDKDQAQAISRTRKLEIAQRSFDLLTDDYGLAPEDIYFDPLVFPVGTGDQNYVGSGGETIEGVRAIKGALPACKTILGVSNVSFGLPPAGREVLNSVFLHHCVEAGLDLAIVNSEGLAPYSRISQEERALSDDLIFFRGDDPVAAFAAHFKGKTVAVNENELAHLSPPERLRLCVIEGTKEGLVENLELERRNRSPLEIINGPLMDGMDEVGRRFATNEMIVAEVLQSAEAMKSAVSHLEQYMDRAQIASRGRLVLATVKGDVHDIGKNLVDIILSNNGFEVINLGIKVPPEELIAACKEHGPDFIGLSGLLVKSARQMVATVGDLADHGIDCPILVGGAALSNRFTRLKISPEYDGLVAYATDAMTGLNIARRLGDADQRRELAEELEQDGERLREAAERKASRTQLLGKGDFAPPRIGSDHEIPSPPDLKTHVIDDYDLSEIFTYINPAMLYNRHLGFKGNFEKALAAGDCKAEQLDAAVAEVERVILSREDIRARAVFRFFPAAAEGNRVCILTPDRSAEAGSFLFGRQQRDGGLCLSDYLEPLGGRREDYLAMFTTTVGPGVRGLAEGLQAEGEYLKSHILQALTIEAAEGFAELLHKRIRTMWGIAEDDAATMKDLFKARYRGLRVSFGYPACPRLEDQELLFILLEVSDRIGVQLTDGLMMDPESSVSAMVLHHPEASYFSLGEADIELLEEALKAQSRSA